MKIIIGILIGISMMFAFQKIMSEKDRSVDRIENIDTKANSTEQIPADFLVFYTQFHSDSIFQITHIDFPFEGLPEYADSTILAQGNFTWQKEDWEMHKNLDARKEDFVKNLLQVSDGLIFEFIPTGGEKKLWIERRFMKTNGDWRMIYYSGLNYRK